MNNKLRELLKGHMMNHAKMMRDIQFESENAPDAVSIACIMTLVGLQMVQAEAVIVIAEQLQRFVDQQEEE